MQDVDTYWDDVYTRGIDFSVLSARSLSRALQDLPVAPSTCLDIGCGTGQLSRELFHRGYRVLGIDASGEAIRIARELTQIPATELAYKKLDFETASLKGLPFMPYGLVTSKLVYAFIKDKPAFLRRVRGVLAQGGTFILVTPMPEDVTQEKQRIAVPFDKTMSELCAVFSRVDSYREQNLTFFRAYDI